MLGFHVDYINTGEIESYENLRETIIEHEQLKNPDKARREIERDVQSWSGLKVEKEAKSRKILQYHDDTHIPRIVEEILNHLDAQSQNRKFNAILTVQYKKRVISYFKEFKNQMETMEHPLNIAMMFSFGGDEE